MGEPIQNHYQVLRIERTADERAVKKAYFTLIREHPPEKDPEEFRRIREAYEVLSDPVARQRFDNLDRDYREYDAEAGDAFRAIEEAEKKGNEPEVQRMLLELIDKQPDLVLAREKLAVSYLRSESFDKALDALDALIEREPDRAAYHLRRGVALHRLERPNNAEAAFRKAYELKPEDLDITLSLIKFFETHRKLDEAHATIDEALQRHPERSPARVLLLLRRVHVCLCSVGGAKRAHEELDTLFAWARESGDPELCKFVSSQLGSIAAALFSKNDVVKANALLARCPDIHPDSLGERPYPPVTRLDLDELPEAGRQWLAHLAPGPERPMIERPIWPLPVLALLGAAGLVSLVMFLVFHKPEPWSTGGSLASVVLFAGCAAALAFSGRWAVRIATSPLRSFFTIHPLYVLDVEARRIDVYPLFGLTDVRATHHHTNGVYTGTQIRLEFSSRWLNVSIRGKQYAEGWLNYLVGCRQRALELMSEGYLDAEHGIELLPPSLLSPARPASRRQANDRRFYAAVAFAGMVLWGVVLPLRAWAVDTHAWRKAVHEGTIASYRAYLAARPAGHYAEEAERLAARPFEQAAATFKGVAKPGAPFAKALLQALETLRATGETQVPVTFVWSSSVPAPGGAQAAALHPTSEPAALSNRRSAWIEGMNAILADAGMGKAMRLVPADPASGSVTSPIALVIEGDARGDGGVFFAEGVPMPEVPSFAVEWKVRLARHGAEGSLWSWTTTVRSPEQIPLPPPGSSNTAEWVNAETVSAALDALARGLAAELGLSSVATVSLRGSAPGAARRSPYAH